MKVCRIKEQSRQTLLHRPSPPPCRLLCQLHGAIPVRPHFLPPTVPAPAGQHLLTGPGFWAPVTLLSSQPWWWQCPSSLADLGAPLSTAGLPGSSSTCATIVVSLFLIGSCSFFSKIVPPFYLAFHLLTRVNISFTVRGTSPIHVLWFFCNT